MPKTMEGLAVYSVLFGIPILLYAVWLVRFQKQCLFTGLLILSVVVVWITLWPVYFGPELHRASFEPNDRADTVVNGFVLLGWIYGLIGCLPIIMFEIPRSILILMRKRRTSKVALDKTKGEQDAPSEGDKHTV
jgi:hypothetical protein